MQENGNECPGPTSAPGRRESEMATIEDFFLQRYEQLESERDGLRARVDDLERQMQADGGYGVRPGGRVRAVLVDAASRYDFPDTSDRCRAAVEALERGESPQVGYGRLVIQVKEAEFPWSFTMVLPGRDPVRYGVKVNGSIEELCEGTGEDGPTDCLGSWVLDLDARQDLEDAARDLALRNAREHLEYVEKQERRRAEREKTDES